MKRFRDAGEKPQEERDKGGGEKKITSLVAWSGKGEGGGSPKVS